jgi:hypothetical protein
VKTIYSDLSCPACGDAPGAVLAIPPDRDGSWYRDADGGIEVGFKVHSIEAERPPGLLSGDVVVLMRGDRGGRIELYLSPRDAERIGVALIQASALPAGDPARPSTN